MMSGGSRVWVSDLGSPIDRVYRASSDAHLGEPGEFPFTRHPYRDGYRIRAWAPSLYSGFGDAKDANERFKFLLSQGNGRANCALDLPTQIGLDSDDPKAHGEVGRVGVAIDSLADIEEMFDGVPLDQVPVSFNVNAIAPVILAMLYVTAERQGVEPAKLTGTLANDILHEYVSRGTWRFPPDPSLRLMADVAEFSLRHMPRFYPFNIRSILLHESGGGPQHELGYTFAIASRYLMELEKRGIGVDAAASRMSFFFGTGLNFLQEAAKFRAARRMWAKLLVDKFDSRDPRAQALRMTSVAPCGSHFTLVDPELNLVRGTLGCLAGALGGVQAMLGTSIDEAYDIPTERTQKLALRTQQIVALESDVCATVDPLGGSYYVEAMTDAIEQAATAELELLKYGEGVVDAINNGQLQSQLADRAYELERAKQTGELPIVGVNVHQDHEKPSTLNLHEPDLALHEGRTILLAELRSKRDQDNVDRSLAKLRRICETNTNVLPTMIEAVKTYATVGEIMNSMESVFGEYREAVAV